MEFVIDNMLACNTTLLTPIIIYILLKRLMTLFTFFTFTKTNSKFLSEFSGTIITVVN